MTIDPELYKKISGRSGDPMDAYGKSLAQTSKKESERNTAVYYEELPGASYFKWKYIFSSVVSLLVLGAIVWGVFFR